MKMGTGGRARLVVHSHPGVYCADYLFWKLTYLMRSVDTPMKKQQ